ncbi:MAG: ThiF family adenylyltransferase [Candidatus Methanofastidiosia archaeon]
MKKQEKKSRTDRQERLEGWNQRKVNQTRVLICGAGALGNELCKSLALLGIGKIYLVDFDFVELSNLNRCLFFRENNAITKAKKAEIVAEKTAELNPEVHVEAIVDRIENVSTSLYKNIDVALGAVDNRAARYWVNQYCYWNDVPYIDGGFSGFAGSVKVIVPPISACLACSYSSEDYEDVFRKDPCTGQQIQNDNPKIPSIVTCSSIVASLQIQEMLKIILGIDSFREKGIWNTQIGIPSIGKHLRFVGRSNEFDVYEMEKNENCPACGWRTMQYVRSSLKMV